MPSSAIAKTKSARRPQLVWLVIALVLCIGTSALIYLWPTQPVLRLGGASYNMSVARTAAQRSQGLGGRQAMATNQGMLFEYPQPVKTCFWMKDMHFSLDMVWVDVGHHVVHIASNVAPRSYPHIFCTPEAAQYVIELTAGQVAAHHVTIGQILSF